MAIKFKSANTEDIVTNGTFDLKNKGVITTKMPVTTCTIFRVVSGDHFRSSRILSAIAISIKSPTKNKPK